MDGAVPDRRYTVISADTHNGPPTTAYRPYVEQRYLDAFDERAGDGRVNFELFSSTFAQWARHNAPPDEDPDESLERFVAICLHAEECWEPKRWVAALEAEGVVASVLQEVPAELGNGLPLGTHPDAEARRAGLRAYNRWLADFCAEVPGRAAGVIQVQALNDVTAVVGEICRAAEDGLRGGVALPKMSSRHPGFHEPVYDPIWATCQAYDLPLIAHAGKQNIASRAVYGDGPAAQALANYDTMAFDRRPLWFMIFGGVFDRFPNLRLVFVEQLADWVPFELGRLRYTEHAYFMVPVRERLELTPVEYWERNCLVSASFMSRAEAEARHAIGLGTIMWGSDFPHPEGTFPRTRESLRHTFGGLPPSEVQMMLGETAARVHHFDLDALAPVAAEVGPTVAELNVPYEGTPEKYVGMAFRPN